MYNCLVINVDELWLKGKNRHIYYNTINNHIRKVVGEYHQSLYTCKTENQRLVVKSETPFSDELIQSVLDIPGINSIAPAIEVELDINKIYQVSKDEFKKFSERPHTFKVKTKRSNKKFSMGSMDVSSNVGGVLLEAYDNLSVDIKNPEIVLDVRILDKAAYISSSKLAGVGGFPVGVHGNLLTLLSGGFDSPVASYMMARRGCKQSLVFFYAYPFVGDEVKDKIVSIAKSLARYQIETDLYIFPFGDIQEKIAEICRPEYRTLLFRKYMILASNVLAEKIGAMALVTGDSLGQVSSQTIHNIMALDNFSKRSIFRPLIGLTKLEIIEWSKKIGIHDLSVIPHDDACAIFAPKHPVLKPDQIYMDKLDEDGAILNLIMRKFEEVDRLSFSFDGKSIN